MKSCFKNVSSVCIMLFAFIHLLIVQLPAQNTTNSKKDAVQKRNDRKELIKKPEVVEKTGTVEVQKATGNQKFNTILLHEGDKVYKLLPGSKENALKIEALNGKTITVKGTLLEATAKYPLPAVKVSSFEEFKTNEPVAD